jgi:hypothetical protein
MWTTQLRGSGRGLRGHPKALHARRRIRKLQR